MPDSALAAIGHAAEAIDPIAAARWSRLPLVVDAQGQPVSPWLHEEVGQRMRQRLQWIRCQPAAWANWQPGRGGLQADAQVAQQYPDSQRIWLVHGVDTAAPATKDVANQPSPGLSGRLEKFEPTGPVAQWARKLPRWWPATRRRDDGPQLCRQVPPQSVQMVWSNMQLHQCADWPALLAQWQAALAADGFVMFSCLGPDTLAELRALYHQRGWPAPVQAFTDMHDWGDRLIQAGFAEPVMDVEHIRLSFETPQRLLQELRELGRNLHPARFAALRGRGWQRQLLAALTALARPEEQGRLVLSFEIIYGHAFKSSPGPAVQTETETRISLEHLRATLRQRRH